MDQKSNNPISFWQELKRRKVFRVIAMYAATAFIIIEAGDIMLPRLGLPDWTVTFIIVLLIIGFPISIILSWIFDITPGGVVKTEPVISSEKEGTPTARTKRKPGTSDLIIAVLLVVVVVLAYPKIFRKDKFENVRDEDGRISIAVMPFENISGDSLYNVWQSGLQNLLITILSNSEELSVRQFQATYAVMKGAKSTNYASITPAMASKVAATLETNTFILGNILKAGNNIRVNAQLLKAGTDEIYKTYQVEGKKEDDIFMMADSLAGLIRSYLEIKILSEQYESPNLKGNIGTNSSEAYKYYIHGWEAYMDIDLQSSMEWCLKAIEVDPEFIRPYIGLSMMYSVTGYDKMAKSWCYRAYEWREELTMTDKLRLDYLYAYYFESPDEQIKYLKQFLEIEELNTLYWYFLGLAYQQQEQYRDAAIYYEKIFEIHKKLGTTCRNVYNYDFLGQCYRELNDHARGKEVLELGLSLFPDYGNIIRELAVFSLIQGDTLEAAKHISKYRSIRMNKDLWSESRVVTGVGDIYYDADLEDEAENKYCQAINLDQKNTVAMNSLAWILIKNESSIDEGLELVEKAIELEPGDWTYLDTKGWGLYKLGRLKEALKVLNDSWELRPYYSHTIYLHIQEVEKALARER